MFTLLDRWYALRKLRQKDTTPKDGWTPEVLSFSEKGPRKKLWLRFVPTMVSKQKFMRRGTLPRDGTVLVYTISSFVLIQPNPRDIVSSLTEIYEDALGRISEALRSDCEIGLLGVSLGNVLAMRLASATQKIDTLVSIVGGDKLGLSAWNSNLTRHIARHPDSGCRSAEAYEDQVKEFSPCHYIPGIHARQIYVRRGTCDLLIPSKYGKELELQLAERGRQTGSRVDPRVYLGADHGAAMFRTALENYRRSFPWS